ncbi:MAG: hypothetical protein IPN86_22805 [Saprospiraceae bacterium]|nr:hypothetical protein [Saprospiraceae bacterium]
MQDIKGSHIMDHSLCKTGSNSFSSDSISYLLPLDSSTLSNRTITNGYFLIPI